jgi:hypothetical protein
MHKKLIDHQRIRVRKMIRKRPPVLIELGFAQEARAEDFVPRHVQHGKALHSSRLVDLDGPDVDFCAHVGDVGPTKKP